MPDLPKVSRWMRVKRFCVGWYSIMAILPESVARIT